MSKAVRVRFDDEVYDVLSKIARNMNPPMSVSSLVREFTESWFAYTSMLNTKEWKEMAEKMVDRIQKSK